MFIIKSHGNVLSLSSTLVEMTTPYQILMMPEHGWECCLNCLNCFTDKEMEEHLFHCWLNSQEWLKHESIEKNSENYRTKILYPTKVYTYCDGLAEVCLQTMEEINKKYTQSKHYICDLNAGYNFDFMLDILATDVLDFLKKNAKQWIQKNNSILQEHNLTCSIHAFRGSSPKVILMWSITGSIFKNVFQAIEIKRKEKIQSPSLRHTCSQSIVKDIVNQYRKVGYLPSRVIEELRHYLSEPLLLEIIVNFYYITKGFHLFR